MKKEKEAPFILHFLNENIMNDQTKTSEELLRELQEFNIERKKANDALQESEETFRTIFENSSAAMAIIEPDTTISMVNEEYCKLIGCSKQEVIGTSWTRQIPPEDLDRLKEYNRRRLLNPSDAPEKYEFTFYQNSGMIRHALMSVAVLRNHKIIASFIDITQRKYAEDAVKQLSDRFSLAARAGGVGVWDYDIINNVLVWDDRMYELYGIQKKDFIGVYEAWQNGVHPDDKDRGDKEIRMAILSEKEFDTEFRVSWPDGSIHNIRALGIVQRDGSGKALRMIGTNWDITKYKQVEEKVRAKDIEFRKLSKNAPGLIFQFTRRPDGTYYVPVASEGIRDIFGCSPEDVLDDFTPIGRVICPEDSARVIDDIEYSAKHMTYFTCEFRVQIPGKAIQWIYSRSTPEKLADGSITWYGFNTDITEHKRAELELFQAKEKAEESDRLKSAFLANMSHEIRTPMNGILGFAQLLKEPNLTGEEQQAYIKIIERSGKRMLNIINDIVDISKIESGQMQVSMSEINISDQMQFVYSFFKPEVEKKGMMLLLQNSLPAKEAIIQSDREKLYAILTNLVGNALKYTNTGFIEMGVKKKGVYLELYVKDTGIGVPETKKELIFHRFRQGNDLTSHFTEGAGLGLSISKAYVELLGGKIWLESEPGKGSTFYFTLPHNTGTNIEVFTEDVSLVTESDNPLVNLKILVAEDDEVSVLLLSKALRKYCREIVTAENGLEAVEACRNHADIDLFLMDIKMPVMDGFEATRLIRKFNKDVIIIAQTAFGLTGDREKAIEAGCNDFISKPLVLEELKVLIRKYFNI